MRSSPARAAIYSAAVWVLCIVAIVVSGAIVLALARQSEQTRKERSYCDDSVRDADGYLPSSCCNADNLDDGKCLEALNLTRDVGRDTSRQVMLSQLSGLTIIVINSIVTKLLVSVTPYERRVQHTTALGSTTTKLIMFYLVNSVAIPIVAVYMTSESDQNWYIPGGIAQDAFYIQLLNIFVPNILSLFNLPYPIFSLLFSHQARTQAMVDKLMHPAPFDLPLRAANMVRTVALSCLYMPVLPVSVILGFLASVASYLVDHVLVLRICAKPPEFGLAAFSASFYFLWLLPLAWLILMQFVFFPSEKFARGQAPEVTAPFLIGVAIWGLASILPLHRLLGLDDQQVKDPNTTGAKCLSYLSLFESASAVCSSRSLVLREARPDQKKSVSEVQYHAVTYGPIVPPECSEEFRNSIHSLYKIYKPPLPENVELLHGQAPDTGGENARPPAPEMVQAASPKVQAMFLKPVPPQARGARGLYASGAAVVDVTSGFAAFTGVVV